MVEFALKVTIVIFITQIIIAPVKIFTEAAASVASTVATALYMAPKVRKSRLILFVEWLLPGINGAYVIYEDVKLFMITLLYFSDTTLKIYVY